ncbi:MAG TPA: MFS transporter [Demequinaceae bacterium]
MSVIRDLRHLMRGAGFRRLAATRLISQLGDGMFQAGLASLLFFDPTKQATAGSIALGFFLLLAPFTLVGPFVGPLIDRWQRQRIILVGNLVRVGLAAFLGYLMITHGPVGVLYVAAVLTLSINRFLLAAMAAAIPRVVADEDLLAANAILPTLGTIAAALGAGIGVVVEFLAPGLGNTQSALAALLASGAVFGLSSWTATALGRRELGPVATLDGTKVREQMSGLLRELRDGARYLARRVTPAQAILVMAAQRLLYGLMFVASILISRQLLSGAGDAQGGLGAFGLVLGFAAVGFGLAAIVTPALGHLVPRHRWVVWCLVVGAGGQALLAASHSRWALLSAAVIVSFAVQGGKIAVDTIVQRDTEDAVRGRAFSLYDVAYNVAFFSSAGIAVLVLPDSGYSRTVMAGMVVAYLVAAALYALAPKEPRALVR